MTSHIHGREDFLVVRMDVFPKLIYRFNTISIIPASFFAETDNLILKLNGNSKAKTKQLLQEQAGRQTLLNFKTYYKHTSQ